MTFPRCRYQRQKEEPKMLGLTIVATYAAVICAAYAIKGR